MTPVEIAAALVRTTLATSAAALVAWALLAWLRIDSPRIHRLAWLLVIAQGWLFFPLTIEIDSGATGILPVRSTERLTNPFLAEAAKGPEYVATSDSAFTDAPPSQQALHVFPLPPIAIASWLLGAIALTAIAARRYLQVLRTLPLGSPPDDLIWQPEWHAARMCARLRRRQSVDLRITANLGPLLHWAPWAYLILVPRTLWTTLAAPERQAILRHELAHLRRGDLWKSLAIRALALPQWFNPLAWLAIRRFDEAAEWACDDAAAATADGRLTFANSLLQSAEYAAAPFPGSAPAARGVLTRRIHRLVSPRFKEESKMKLLLVPTLLTIAAVAQIVRIESVVADEPPAAASTAPAQKTARRSAPPLHQQQLDFDQLAKEFENFSRMTYVIEPPDIVSIRISYHISRLDRAKGPLSDVELPRLKIAECMDKAPRRYAVGMDGCVRLNKVTSIYIAGMTLREAEDAIQTKLAPQGMEVGVRLSVAQFNSKVYYVITKGAALGDHATRLPIPFPVDGKENVAEALARAYDNADRKLELSELASASLTLLRPAPNGVGDERVYPIIWDPSTQAPTPLTNHGMLPGDRILVELTPAAIKKRENELPSAYGPPPVEASPSINYYALLELERSPTAPPITRGDSYRLQPYDTLKLRVVRPHRPAHVLTWGDIEGEFTVDHRGEIEFGRNMGVVAVAGLSLDEARAAIERQLRKESPDCEVQLALVTLAAEKYVISIQRSDGTKLAVGALRPEGLSEEEFFRFRSFVGDLVPIQEVKLERTDPHGDVESIKLSTVWDAVQSPQMTANEYNVRPGDRLIITVADDWRPSLYPLWLVPCDVEGERGQMRMRIVPGWSPAFSTQFDHPDIQRPPVTVRY